MKLPAQELAAIEFSPSTQQNVQSFSDPAWEVIKGDDTSVRRSENTLEMDAGTSIGLGSLMQCGDFSFKYSSNGFSGLRVRMFFAGKDTTHSTNLLLCNTGGQITAGLESADGRLENQSKPGRGRADLPTAVRIKIGGDQLELFVINISMGQFPIDPAKCAGAGVVVEPASVWGNSVFTVSLSDFPRAPFPGRSMAAGS